MLWIPTQPVSDFRDYFQRAVSLRETGAYSPDPAVPDAAYPPAYPLFLLLALSFPSGTDPLLAAKIANCLLGAAAIVIGGHLGRALGGDRAGLAAAVVFALNPRSLLMTGFLASENLFSPLLLLFVCLAVRAASAPPSPGRTLGAGIVVGLLALTRSVAYGIGIVWALAGVAARRPPRRIAMELVVLLVVQHAVMLPWALRNRRELGGFTLLTSTGGIGLFAGNNPAATGDWYPWQADLERLRPGVSAGSPVEVDRAARAEAIEWIRANPGRAAALYLARLRLILVQDHLAADWAIFAEKVPPPEPGLSVLPGPHPLKGHRAAVTLLLRIAGLLLALAACGGLVVLRKKRVARDAPVAAGLVAIVAAAAYLLFVSALFASNGRYRWPLEDLAVPLAAVLIARLAPGRREEPVITSRPLETGGSFS